MKQKPCLRCLSVLLILCLLLSGLPVSGAAAQAVGAEESLSPAPEPPLQEEIITPEPLDTGGILSLVDAQTFEAQGFTRRVTEDESLSTYVFQKETGEKTVYFFGENVKYEKDGVIYHKDLTLVPQSGGYGVAQNEVALHLPQNPAKGILVAYGGMGIRILPQGLASGIQGIAENGAVVYENAYGNGIDLKYTPIFSGVKEDIILPQYMQEASFSFLLETVGASLYQDGQGWYLAADAQAEPALRMGDTLVYDAIGKPCQGGLTVETVTPGSQYRVTVSAPDSFLSDPETVYPVTIDPTVTISDNSDGAGTIEDATLFAGYPNYNYADFLFNSIGLTQVNFGTARTAIKLTGFINSSLYESLSADQIVSVKFGAAEASGRPAQFIHLYPLTTNTTWTETTVTWNNVGSYSTAMDCGDYLTDSLFTKFDITPLVKAWKNGTYNANAGFILINDDETAYKQMFACEYTTADYRPYVVIEYMPKIVLDRSSASIFKNQAIQLQVTTDLENQAITWSSSNTSVATVSNTGVVTGVIEGRTVITATVTDSSGETATASCTIYVRIADGIYHIQSLYSNLYAEVQSAGIGNNANVQLNGLRSSSAAKPLRLCQMWKIKYLGNGRYSIRPMHKLDMGLYVGGQDVNIYSIGTTDTSNTVGISAQWTIEWISMGYVLKQGGATNYTLRMKTVSTSSGVELSVGTYSGSNTTHHWNLVAANTLSPGVLLYDTATSEYIPYKTKYVAPGESRTLSSLCVTAAVYSNAVIDQSVVWESMDTSVARVDALSGQVTGISPGTAGIRARTEVNGSVMSATYYVEVTELSNGTYFVNNKETEKYIDIENQNMAGGTQVHQWDLHGGDSQRWIFTHLGDGYYAIQSANSTDCYYLGVLEDSTENDVSVVITTGAITDGKKWKVSISSSGGYIITPKTGEANNRVLALDSISSTNGVEIKQIGYVADTTYNDEWKLYLFRDYSLMYIGSINGDLLMPPILNAVQNALSENAHMSGYASVSTTKAELQVQLVSTRLFSCLTHGEIDRIQTTDGLLLISDIDAYDDTAFSNLEFVCLGSCLTGVGRQNGENLVNAFHEKGADTVLGFVVSINCVEANIWMQQFMISLSNGHSVNSASLEADLLIQLQYDEWEITTSEEYRYIAGNDITPCP